ncbi:hypothetical protein GO491_08315 [Flavobacteriaceae bacterium Ap0902]|nr:hypothetical protein [Flavobacteriaceae bacterium Ap0902]
MNKLYQLPAYLQWMIAITSIVLGFGLMIPLMSQPYGILILPLIAPFLNLSSVHFLKLVGYYKYLNPFVISTVQTNHKYDLHNVFTYDYLINFQWKDRGRHAQKVLLGNYMRALLTIIERIENEKLSTRR